MLCRAAFVFEIYLSMNRELINKVEIKVKSFLENDSSGHDWWHIQRVRKNALQLCETEQADAFLVELAVLVHDVGDYKLHGGDEEKGKRFFEDFLNGFELSEVIKEKIKMIVNEVSFKGASIETPVSCIESALVQDADRLDAIGAIGIARAFAYGGSKNRIMYEPNSTYIQHSTFEEYKNNKGNTILHFYEKLLLLKNRMNTESAKKEAAKRHAFMEQYLIQFFEEWGEKPPLSY